MSPERQRLIRLLFDEYIAMYAGRDARLLARFSDNFSGLAGDGTLIKNRSAWINAMLQDFAQAPGPIAIEVADLLVQELGEEVLAATAILHLHRPMPTSTPETARLVLVFRREGSDWAIAHSSSAIAFGAPGPQPPDPGLQALLQERTQALEAANQHIALLRDTDALTGLASRRCFDQRLAQHWEAAQRASAPLALVLLDIDQFKPFNAHYGHLSGDACLQALALVLAQTAASGDLAARWGGDRLAVLLPGADAQAAMARAEQIRAAIALLALPHAAAPSGVVTVSLGVASLQPLRGQLPELLVRQADHALCRAKQAPD